MATEISLADVDQAEARLRDAKDADKGHKDVAAEVAALRSAYRAQEERAGRRTGFVETVEEG